MRIRTQVLFLKVGANFRKSRPRVEKTRVVPREDTESLVDCSRLFRQYDLVVEFYGQVFRSSSVPRFTEIEGNSKAKGRLFLHGGKRYTSFFYNRDHFSPPTLLNNATLFVVVVVAARSACHEPRQVSRPGCRFATGATERSQGSPRVVPGFALSRGKTYSLRVFRGVVPPMERQ
jgi:hypothetical protein